LPEYSIIEVPSGTIQKPEQLGAKSKFWFDGKDGFEYLCKFGRPDSGEDWSEKIAAEVADLLGIPHAVYELATCEGKRCVISRSVVPPEAMIVHGNQLLGYVDPAYGSADRVRRYGEPSHTLEAIHRALDLIECRAPAGFAAEGLSINAKAAFAGYILLDALVGNTDRHHQNWAVTIAPGGLQACLAATFDHASCLGRDLSEEKRTERLESRDAGFSPEGYAERARSALFHPGETHRSMSTIEAFGRVRDLHPDHAKGWLDRLEYISEWQFADILAAVPESRMPSSAKEFARRIMMHNRTRLLKLREGS